MYWFDYVSFPEYILKYMLYDEMASTCKSTFTKYQTWYQTWWLTQRKDLVQLFELWAELAAFLMEYHFTWKNGWPSMVIQTWIFSRHFLYKKNNWQYLLLMIKFKLSSENGILGDLYLLLCLTVSQYFLIRAVVVLMNVIYWSFVVKVSTFRRAV